MIEATFSRKHGVLLINRVRVHNYFAPFNIFSDKKRIRRAFIRRCSNTLTLTCGNNQDPSEVCYTRTAKKRGQENSLIPATRCGVVPFTILRCWLRPTRTLPASIRSYINYRQVFMVTVSLHATLLNSRGSFSDAIKAVKLSPSRTLFSYFHLTTF